MKRFRKALHKVFKHDQRGFTLIELLVVIGILGILGAVVALNVGQFIGSGCDEAALTELHNAQTAVLAYMASNGGTVPADMAACAAYIVGTPHGTYTINQTTGEVTQTAYSPCVAPAP